MKIWLSQKNYINMIWQCLTRKTVSQFLPLIVLISSYILVCVLGVKQSKFDVCYDAVEVITGYMPIPIGMHCKTSKRILRYI